MNRALYSAGKCFLLREMKPAIVREDFTSVKAKKINRHTKNLKRFEDEGITMTSLPRKQKVGNEAAPKKERQSAPTEKEILALVGAKAASWTDLRTYLATHYDHVPELAVGRKEHDWTFRYRKGGKTLVTLSPEENDFCVLVVLGAEEVRSAEQEKGMLSEGVRRILETSKQYHDGRWLWIRPRNARDLESIKTLLAIKRKPKEART
jgi:hypothetical protein